MNKLYVLLLFLGLKTIAQNKITEGIITTSQIMMSSNKQVNDRFKKTGSTISIKYFKDSKLRSEIYNPLSDKITIISDKSQRKRLILMNSPKDGKKFLFNTISNDIDNNKGVKIIEGTKTKTILGYVCRQQTAIVNKHGFDFKIVMYVTTKIPHIRTKETEILGNSLKGYPMHMTMALNFKGANKTVTEVVEIKSEVVPESKFSFKPPNGYTEMQGL